MISLHVNHVDLKTQAKIAIRRYIDSMDLDRDNKLPREEQLCEMIGVSRVTLRSALNELSSEGIVIRRQGKGTFVNPTSQKIKVSFNPASHFFDMIVNSGYTPSVKALGYSRQTAERQVADALEIPAGSPVIAVEKLFYADDRLCSYCLDYFPQDLCSPQTLRALAHYPDSTFQFLYDATGRKVSWDKVEIDTTDSVETPALARYGEPSPHGCRPFLLLRGVNYDEDDKPFVYVLEHVDTALLKFSQIRKREYFYKPRSPLSV